MAITACGSDGVVDGDLGSETLAATSLRVAVVHSDSRHRVMAVSGGTIYALDVTAGANRLFASVDRGSSWTQRTKLLDGRYFKVMTALASGALLADTADGSGEHTMMRSGDLGVTWQPVLALGQYRWLQPHSVAELDGTVFYAQYQVFAKIAPVTLFASADDGVTWRSRYTWTTRRHAHSLLADPATHSLYCFLGDPTGGLVRSRDGGATFESVVEGSRGIAVDGVFTPTGNLIFGNDIVYGDGGPNQITRVRPSGAVELLATLPGPSYSVQHRWTRGYLLGETREAVPDGVSSVYDPADLSAHLYSSGDTTQWKEVMRLPRVNPDDYARIDVYWQLPTGEAVIELRNVSGYGVNGTGFLLATTTPY